MQAPNTVEKRPIEAVSLPVKSQPTPSKVLKRSDLAVQYGLDPTVSAASTNADSNGNSSTNSLTHLKPRPVKSCTHCRQQKIRCNAAETYPAPCTRCSKMDRKCVVDPFFKPQKGGQVQSLREDISSLKMQLQALQRKNEMSPSNDLASSRSTSPSSTATIAEYQNLTYSPSMDSNSRVLFGDSLPNKQHNMHLHKVMASPYQSSSSVPISKIVHDDSYIDTNRPGDKIPEDHIHSSRNSSIAPSSDYIVGDVRLPFDKAEELHKRFMKNYLPFLPIIQSNSAAELYRQSQLLFWTVCLTASLSEPVPDLYNSLCSLIKQLAIETCWIQTPRSTHIVQALLILGNWPLPNEKVLDDCSYRFITLAKSLAMQLGLHRGKFIYEFSRTQVSLPDAEKWRTRTWIAIFIAEQVWCANLGLPPNMPMDYLLEESRTDTSLPKSFRSLACLAMFCSKLVNLLGASVTSPDGTLEPKNRFSTLGIMEQELDRLIAEMGTEDVTVEIYSLYLKMMICVFSFLPETPIQDQTIYIIKAYHAATRVVTLFSSLAEQRRIIEYPIYIRQPVSLAAFILFRLHLSPLLLPQYVESSRQSVVTVHRLFRNMLTAWKDVENDISRTAKVLEKLNFVIISHPELFTKAPGIITRMRSHLTASLFYELIWAIHEARRRGGIGSSSTIAAAFVAAAQAAKTKGSNGNGSAAPINPSYNTMSGSHVDSVPPLPFYNQITKDDFTTTTTTTPNGTTITTLVPTATTVQQIPTTNTTPLAGIGNPSTMLVTTAGPDVAGFGTTPTTSKEPTTTVPPSATSGAFYDTTGSSTDPLHLDTLMRGMDWMDNQGDDLLGWMDNMDFSR